MKLEKMTLEELKEILEKQTYYEYEIISYWRDADTINVKGLKNNDRAHIDFSFYTCDTRNAKKGTMFIGVGAFNSIGGQGKPLNSIEELINWVKNLDHWFGYKIPRKRKQVEQLSLF